MKTIYSFVLAKLLNSSTLISNSFSVENLSLEIPRTLLILVTEMWVVCDGGGGGLSRSVLPYRSVANGVIVGKKKIM